MNSMNEIPALRGGGTTYLHQICPVSSLGRGEVSFCVTEISLFLENIQKTSAGLSLIFFLFIWGFTSLSTLYRSYHDG